MAAALGIGYGIRLAEQPAASGEEASQYHMTAKAEAAARDAAEAAKSAEVQVDMRNLRLRALTVVGNNEVRVPVWKSQPPERIGTDS